MQAYLLVSGPTMLSFIKWYILIFQYKMVNDIVQKFIRLALTEANKMEMRGIEPRTSRMQSERSTM